MALTPPEYTKRKNRLIIKFGMYTKGFLKEAIRLLFVR
jgi:hypothetical protein